MTRLLILPGDGIGPEIVAAARQVLEAVAPSLRQPLNFSQAAIGFEALAQCGTTFPPEVIDAARAADGVILGPVSHQEYPPRDQGGLNPSGGLRTALELYANIRPARTWAGLPAPTGARFDLVTVRENLEGFYADRNLHQGNGEFMPVPGVAMSLRKITAEGSRRIAERGFAIANARPDKKLTAIHKSNVLRVGDGLFLEVVRDVAKNYPAVELDELLVDAAAAHLVRHPERFGVLLTTNMFGDILSDLAAELSGSLGLAASLNVGHEHAVAQAAHGSAPDIAGKDRANPCSLILSAAMLLRHLGESAAAARIESAVANAIAKPDTRTSDLGGPLGTRAFTDALCEQLQADV